MKRSLFQTCRFSICFVSIFAANARASEIVTYSYDTQGRLIDAAHAGTGPNSALDIQYQYDLANNRTAQNVTGSKNTGQQVVVVPMGSGFNIIPINP